MAQSKPSSGRSQPLEGGVGASDATNGGGSGAGIPDGDTAMTAGAAVTRGDVQKDKEKLFPDAGQSSAGQSSQQK